jgi:hypothetical protein
LFDSLATAEPAALAQRLLAEGFPRRVVGALVGQRFELQARELAAPADDTPYWRRPATARPDAARIAALARLREEQEQLAATLGAGDDDGALMRRRQFGDLPIEKMRQVEKLVREQGERMAQAGPADAARMDREAHAELAKVLTPAELLEYDLRNSATSRRLRDDLTGMDVSESDFRALFSLYQAAEAQVPVGTATQPTPAELQARAAAQTALREQVKATLTPAQFADYERASRPELRQLNTLVARLGLPLAAAAEVAAVRDDVQRRSAMVTSNAQLSADERTRQLTTLADEARTKITAAIGARGLAGYRQNGGEWLDRLAGRSPSRK